MTVDSDSLPLLSRLVLVDSDGIARGLERVRASGLAHEEDIPNAWQVTLGVLRMWHRLIYRRESMGTGGGLRARATWRAQLLRFQPLRLPFLLAEKAVAPLDFSGLLSTKARLISHLLGAHHDRNEFVYDFDLLRLHPGALEELLVLARDIAESSSPRAAWLRDLCVYEGYHARLATALEQELARPPTSVAPDGAGPDDSFLAYLAWCAKQPRTFHDTWHALKRGTFDFGHGITESGAAAA